MKTKKKGLLHKIEHFFSPILDEDQKKRSSARIEHFFPKFTLSCTLIQIIGGMQLLGGIQPNYWGIYPPPPPPPPGFGTPVCHNLKALIFARIGVKLSYFCTEIAKSIAPKPPMAFFGRDSSYLIDNSFVVIFYCLFDILSTLALVKCLIV